MRGVLVFAFLSAAAFPAAARVELVLPANSDRSAPGQFLLGLAASGLVRGGNVRPARRGETAYLFVEARLGELAIEPEVARTLEAIGLRTIMFQVSPDGDVLRLVASVSLEHDAPRPPFTNRELLPPATGDERALRQAQGALSSSKGGPRAWAAAAVSLDAERVVPWLLAVADRRDHPGPLAARAANRPGAAAPGIGRFLRDALAVIKWNLGLDLDRDVARALGGTIRFRAAAPSGADEAALSAEVRSVENLSRALARLAAGSQVMGKAGPRLDPARLGGGSGYRLRPAWKGIGPALAIVGDHLLAETRPRLIESDARRLIERLLPVREAELPRVARQVGHVDRCAVAVVDVLAAVRAWGRAARLAGLDEALPPAPGSIPWADGTAAFAVRLGEDCLQVFGAWVAGRSALGCGSDEWIAEGGSPSPGRDRLMPARFGCTMPVAKRR